MIVTSRISRSGSIAAARSPERRATTDLLGVQGSFKVAVTAWRVRDTPVAV
jgi:hypothetical protein